MEIALQKTLAFLLLIALGLILRRTLSAPAHQYTLKVLILQLALPAVIFLALMKLELSFGMLIVPLAAIAYSFLMLLACRFLLPFFGIPKDSADMRTFLLLLPSLAPGLSCFSFVVTFLGEEALAQAALADVGNKISVLFFSYLLAIYWFYQKNQNIRPSGNNRLKSLAIGMLQEPINVVMLIAVALLFLHVRLEQFPPFLYESLTLLGQLMAPLILLYVGISVSANWKQLKLIAKLLVFRSGLSFCLSALVLYFLPSGDPILTLLIVAFPQSACSFWPLAHMTAVDQMSKKHETTTQIFDQKLAANILAISMPFSIAIILTIFNSGSFFTEFNHTSMVGLGLLFFSSLFLSKGLRLKMKPKSVLQQSSSE